MSSQSTADRAEEAPGFYWYTADTDTFLKPSLFEQSGSLLFRSLN